MDAERTSETSVDIQLTRQYIPESSELNTVMSLTGNVWSKLSVWTLFRVHLREQFFLFDH
jgi:hypothetical protein